MDAIEMQNPYQATLEVQEGTESKFQTRAIGVACFGMMLALGVGLISFTYNNWLGTGSFFPSSPGEWFIPAFITVHFFAQMGMGIGLFSGNRKLTLTSLSCIPISFLFYYLVW